MLAVILIVCAGVALLRVALGLAIRHGLWPRPTVSRQAAALLAGGLATAALAVGLASGAARQALQRLGRLQAAVRPASDQGRERFSSALRQRPLPVLASAPRRLLRASPLTGIGPGTFEYWWAATGTSRLRPRRPQPLPRDAGRARDSRLDAAPGGARQRLRGRDRQVEAGRGVRAGPARGRPRGGGRLRDRGGDRLGLGDDRDPGRLPAAGGRGAAHLGGRPPAGGRQDGQVRQSENRARRSGAGLAGGDRDADAGRPRRAPKPGRRARGATGQRPGRRSERRALRGVRRQPQPSARPRARGPGQPGGRPRPRRGRQPARNPPTGAPGSPCLGSRPSADSRRPPSTPIAPRAPSTPARPCSQAEAARDHDEALPDARSRERRDPRAEAASPPSASDCWRRRGCSSRRGRGRGRRSGARSPGACGRAPPAASGCDC